MRSPMSTVSRTWAKLKSHVEALGLSPAEALKAAVCDSDALRVGETLERYPELRAKIDDPLPNYGFGQHALFAAVQRSDRATIDVLLRAGADIQKRTEWWAGGFGVLDDCDPSLVEFLIERGAVLDAHSAARLGMMPKLESWWPPIRAWSTQRWRRTDAAALRLHRRGCGFSSRERRRD